MFIKVTHSGPRRYVQLVEAYRDAEGRPKQRTVATLGRLDQLGCELESVISGLMRVTGKSLPEPAPVPVVTFEPARDFGDVWTLTELWNSLGFDRLRKTFRPTRHTCEATVAARLHVQGVPDATILPWEHTIDSTGKPCPNPRVVVPRRLIPRIVNEPEQVDITPSACACRRRQP